MGQLFAMIALLGAVAVGAASPAAQASDRFARRATRTPAVVTELCASCHGKLGNSTDPTVPSLAGQGRAYLLRQLVAFKAQRRVGVMSGIAMGLGEADMRHAATYFSRQGARWNPYRSVAAVGSARGRAIYEVGIAADHVPACASCHALDGSGLLPEFPRLAGQHARYVAGQLRAFRADSRLSNPNAMMRAVAARLSDADIEAVADYIAGMPQEPGR